MQRASRRPPQRTVQVPTEASDEHPRSHVQLVLGDEHYFLLGGCYLGDLEAGSDWSSGHMSSFKTKKKQKATARLQYSCPEVP